MTYRGPGGFGRIVNIIMNVFMCAAFSFFMLWTMQQRVGDMAQILTPSAFILSFITAFGIGFTTADLIPVFSAGSAVARKLNLKGVPAYFVTVLVIDLIITTIMGFLMTCINMVERAGFMGAFMTWLGLWPISLLIGYIVQLIVMKPAMTFAKNVTGFDPENPTPPFGMPGGPGAGDPMGGPAGGPNAGGPMGGPAGGPAGGPGAGAPAGGPAGGPNAGDPSASGPAGDPGASNQAD